MADIRNLRQELIKTVNSAGLLKGSRQISLVITNLQEAMMFTGNFLKYSKLGDNPYAKQDGNRKTVQDIEPLFDGTLEVIKGFETDSDLNEIQKIDVLRQRVEGFIVLFSVYIADEGNTYFQDLTKGDEFNLVVCAAALQTSLMKSKMWLGMELGAIRDAEGK